MLRIFHSDLEINKINSLFKEIRENIIADLESDSSLKNFFLSFFNINNEEIKNFIKKIVGEIEEDSEVCQCGKELIDRCEQYSNLYKKIESLLKYTKINVEETIDKPIYQGGIDCLKDLNDFVHETKINLNQLSEKEEAINLEYVSSYDPVNSKRIPQEEKVNLINRIKEIYEDLEDIYNNMKKLKTIFSYEKNISRSGKRSELASYIGLATCPYCNLNRLDLIKVKKNNNNDQKSAKCELDHYLPKSKYPLFASSVWNLIPVCRTCNLNKWENELHFYSWNIDLQSEIIKILVKFNDSQAIEQYLGMKNSNKECNFDITFICSFSDLYEDVKLLQLEELYNERSEISDLLNKLLIDFRTCRNKSIKDILIFNGIDNGQDLFKYYFGFSLSDYKEKHYSVKQCAKLVSEFIANYGPDISYFEN